MRMGSLRIGLDVCVCVCITTIGKFWAQARKAGTHRSWFDHVAGGTFEVSFLELVFFFGWGEGGAGHIKRWSLWFLSEGRHDTFKQ
jgi:hypothetical protein